MMDFHLRILSLFVLILEYSLAQLTTPYLGSEMNCPQADTKMMMNEVTWGVRYRAYLTVPRKMRIAPSTLPAEDEPGLGVISDTFIPKYTWLGEYDGEIVESDLESEVGDYAWSVRRNDELMGLVDAGPVDRGTYLRFVNMPNHQREENVVPMECYTKVFYMTIKDIAPGSELFVYYGPNYALNLGFDLNDYYDLPTRWKNVGVNLNEHEHRVRIYDEDLDLQDLRSFSPLDLPKLTNFFNSSRQG